MLTRVKLFTANLIGFAVLFIWGGVKIAQAQWTEPEPVEPNWGTAMTAVWISNDGLRLYLSAGLDAVGWAERDSINGEWGQWTALPLHINASNTQTSMCESPSGDTLYFTSNSDERGDGFGWMDIYYCVLTDTGWGPAINAGPSINGTGREWSVSISRDGSMLLVAGQNPPEAASHNLYYCQRQLDGTWGPKISFGTNINTARDEEHPSISQDKHVLYYYKVGPHGGDIWVSHLIDSVWTEGVQLPAPVNSGLREMNPCIDMDSRTLWYRRGTLQTEYRIVTSTDTTVSAVETPRQPFPSGTGIRLLNASPSEIIFDLTGMSVHAPFQVSVHNILGQEIMQKDFGALDRHVSLGLPQLASGTYLLTVRISEKHITKKFEVTH